MKTENGKAFIRAAGEKIIRADAMGTKTTWTTDDHLKALAKTLADVEPKDGVRVEAQFLEILEDTYNISGFSQWLERKFAAKTGHYVRRDQKGKTQTPSELETMLDDMLKPVAPAKPAETTAS